MENGKIVFSEMQFEKFKWNEGNGTIGLDRVIASPCDIHSEWEGESEGEVDGDSEEDGDADGDGETDLEGEVSGK